MLENDETFALAGTECGIEIRVPKRSHTISADELGELDTLYEERSTFGQPAGWGLLVKELREMRRAVEAGVVVNVEGSPTTMKSWQNFYDWAHGRYSMLEDGYDS